MNVSGTKLFSFLIIFLVITIVLSNYIAGKLLIFIICIFLIILILFSVYFELRMEKIGNEFDEIVMKSTNIENTLLNLYNKKRYRYHILEYNENKKNIIENDNEIIINNKSNVFLIRISLKGIEYKNFFKKKLISYDEIISIEDSYISGWNGKQKGIIIKLKAQITGKKIFIPWENTTNLPLRRALIIYKINNFIKTNNIKLAS